MATVIGYGNLIDAATLAGTWTNTANLKNRYLAQKASAGAGAYLDINLGSAQSIGLVALVADTLTSGTVTITAGATQGATTFSSGALSVYSGADFAHTFAAVSYQWWRITVSAAGTVGRVFIGQSYKPTNNIDWSPSIQIESRAQISESLGGQEYFDARASRRVWRAKFSWLNDAEAYQWYAIQQAQDVSGEVYLIDDDTDTTYRGQRNFLGRLRTLDAIEWPYVSQHAVGLEIAELL